jgi:hypothetical protein
MYLSARDLGGRGLYILARGHIIDQTLDRVILVLAVAVAEEVQGALALVGSIAGVDDRQSREVRIDD